jgi:D-mannonate dehydratase
LHLSIATDGHDHPDDDQWAANSISSSAAVIEMLGEGYEIIEDKPLNQPNWPTYWTLFFKKK